MSTNDKAKVCQSKLQAWIWLYIVLNKQQMFITVTG